MVRSVFDKNGVVQYVYLDANCLNAIVLARFCSKILAVNGQSDLIGGKFHFFADKGNINSFSQECTLSHSHSRYSPVIHTTPSTS
jgi:hypothetical protein